MRSIDDFLSQLKASRYRGFLCIKRFDKILPEQMILNFINPSELKIKWKLYRQSLIGAILCRIQK